METPSVGKMAEDESEGKEAFTRGNEWEVVQLTASTYAAAPGPEGFESNDGDKGDDYAEDKEASRAMFMSQHFVFPPREHELPLEPDNSEIHIKSGGEGVGPKEDRLEIEEGLKSYEKNEENWNIKELTSAEELHGIQFFDEKGKGLSVHGTDFEECTALQELNLVKEGESIYNTVRFSSFHGEADISGSTMYEEDTVFSEPIDPSQRSLDSPDNFLEPLSPTKEDKYNESGLPCEAWWKRGAASLYAHAKEANSFWSVFVAAALMGLIIIGQRWQQERWQVQQLKWQFSITDEKMTQMLGPITRFKAVIVGGHRRGYAIRSSASSER